MCPNCRAFISISDRVCPYCDVNVGPRAIDLRASDVASSLLPRANLTSIIILSLNCFFFLLEILVSRASAGSSVGNVGGMFDVNLRALVLLGAKYAPLIYAGQWWRLITAGFLHGGFVHLAMNSYALFILVTEVEQFYGTARLIVAYVLATFTGFLFSLFFNPGSPSLGASAAAFGLIGIMLAMSLRRRSDPLVQMVRAQYTQWVIFSLVLSFLPGVDLAAHIGGFVGGFFVGVVAGLPGLPRSRRETLWTALGALAVLVVIYAFVRDAFSYAVLTRQL
jgi:rhomboid protease GluP